MSAVILMGCNLLSRHGAISHFCSNVFSGTAARPFTLREVDLGLEVHVPSLELSLVLRIHAMTWSCLLASGPSVSESGIRIHAYAMRNISGPCIGLGVVDDCYCDTAVARGSVAHVLVAIMTLPSTC